MLYVFEERRVCSVFNNKEEKKIEQIRKQETKTLSIGATVKVWVSQDYQLEKPEICLISQKYESKYQGKLSVRNTSQNYPLKL